MDQELFNQIIANTINTAGAGECNRACVGLLISALVTATCIVHELDEDAGSQLFDDIAAVVDGTRKYQAKRGES